MEGTIGIKGKVGIGGNLGIMVGRPGNGNSGPMLMMGSGRNMDSRKDGCGCGMGLETVLCMVSREVAVADLEVVRNSGDEYALAISVCIGSFRFNKSRDAQHRCKLLRNKGPRKRRGRRLSLEAIYRKIKNLKIEIY